MTAPSSGARRTLVNNLETHASATLSRREFLNLSALGVAGTTLLLLGAAGCGDGSKGSATNELVFTS